jgi:hypothetical protein
MSFYFEGINGSGDTTTHFLMAKYAWKHPYLFFDHWGKPVFTILSSPFAQLGISYVKLYNVLMYFAAFALTFRLAGLLVPAYSWWILPIFFCAPDAIGSMFSSLTEPTFACLLAAALLAIKQQQWSLGLVLASFLPMSRSEGLVVLVVFGVYTILHGKYLYMPLLLFGQFVVALAGVSIYGNILWVFTEIPYATLNSNYPSGSIWHYSRSLPYVFGIVSTVLLYAAFVVYIIRLINNIFIQKKLSQARHIRFVVYGSFAAFLFSHSLLHYLGSFNDMGLIRVFTAMMPCMALMAIDCIVWFDKRLLCYRIRWRKPAAAILITLMVVFGYFASVYAWNAQKQLLPTPIQLFYSNTLVPYLKERYPDHKLYFSDSEIALRYPIDIYEKSPFATLLKSKLPHFLLAHDEILIWDSWYSQIEEHITVEQLSSIPHLVQDTLFTVSDGNSVCSIAIFKAKH